MTAFFRGIPSRSREWNVLFSGRFAGMEILFSVEFRRVHLVIPAKAGIHFSDKFPHSPLFAKKMCGDSKLNFRVKFAGIPKFIFAEFLCIRRNGKFIFGKILSRSPEWKIYFR